MSGREPPTKTELSRFEVEVTGIELTADQAEAIQNEMSRIVARRVQEQQGKLGEQREK